MAKQYTKPYLDSNIYIWTIVGPQGDETEKPRISAEILELAEKGSFQVYASTFIEAEVVKDPHSPPLNEEQEQTISRFFDRNFFVWLEVDRLIAQKARQLVREWKWKPPDAIHVATALRAGCDSLLTWDKALRHDQDCLTVEGMDICVPHTAGWQTSFTEPELAL